MTDPASDRYSRSRAYYRVGNLNGDGREDVGIEVPLSDAKAPDVGAVYLLYGLRHVEREAETSPTSIRTTEKRTKTPTSTTATTVSGAPEFTTKAAQTPRATETLHHTRIVELHDLRLITDYEFASLTNSHDVPIVVP